MRAFMYASGRNVWKRSTKNDILRERAVGRPRRGRGRGRGPAGAPPGGDDAQALDADWLKDVETVGITAGASAPEAVVQA